MDLLRVISSHPAVAELARSLTQRTHAVATGSHGSSVHLLAGAVAVLTRRPTALILAHLDEADEAAEELSACGVDVVHLPGLEVLPGESSVSAELLAERLGAVRALMSWRAEASDAKPRVLLAPIQALMQSVPAPAKLERVALQLARGDRKSPASLLKWLDDAGYRRMDAAEEPGDYAVRGGIIDICMAGGHITPRGGPREVAAAPIRLDFFGDDLDQLAEIDPQTLAPGRQLDRVEVVAAGGSSAVLSDDGVSALDLLPEGTLAIIAETMEVTEQGRGYFERVSEGRGVFGPPAVFKALRARCAAIAEVNQFSAGASVADARIELPFELLPSFANDATDAVKELIERAAETPTLVCCQNPGELQRFQELLLAASGGGVAKQPRIEPELRYIHRGFVVSGTLAVVPYHELVHRYQTRRRAVRLKSSRAMDTFLDIATGDYVVHADHGIARFQGLKLIKPKPDPAHKLQSEGGQIPDSLAAGQKRDVAEPQEYLTLEFAGNAKLHVPAINIDQVQKYVGGFSGKPTLSTLGGQRWKGQKERVAESVRDLAAEMLRVRAAREHMPGISYPADTAWQREFEDEFPYEETEDQLAALVELKKDMTSPRPMDRLICGDVGFGKTELAIRAAFKACEFGKQVAVLVPTTVLAEQHERTFRSRFAGYPFRIESLSRFKSDAEARLILESVRKGHVDLLIGTHRILSEDVKFADLGLVVIDEEQRFGVEHKERLLRLRLTVDVLTLSATPIPRTLHMAMLGLRDISSLTTPPLARRAIVTEVIPYNTKRVEQAIARELAREGQIYYVHNKISDILSVADNVQKLAPGAKIVVGHGQMDPHELEAVMLKFTRREADILVSTTIIESGLDNPHANTMIIDDADRFGLAELHQLRGRVGRSKHRAYCYLLLDPDKSVREVAQKRLKAIEQYSMLGAGFKIAMRDLEIRGAGNLLGSEQSGHIAAVGYEMYCRLLDEAVRGMKDEAPPITASSAAIDIGVFGSIPKPYIPSDQRRLEAYRRLATAGSPSDLAKVTADIAAAYGTLPAPVQRLVALSEVRVLAATLGVKQVARRGTDILFRTPSPESLVARLNRAVLTPRAPAPTSSLVGLRATTVKPSRPATLREPAKELDVRVLPPPHGESLHEVYLRLPASYFEPESLLRVLKLRLSER